jgi:hypothetical protein
MINGFPVTAGTEEARHALALARGSKPRPAQWDAVEVGGSAHPTGRLFAAVFEQRPNVDEPTALGDLRSPTLALLIVNVGGPSPNSPEDHRGLARKVVGIAVLADAPAALRVE